MGKIYIEEHEGSERAAFLRGILTRSLQDAGLGFHDAYQISTEIRHKLSQSDSGDIILTTEELKNTIEQFLRDNNKSEIADNYLSSVNVPATIYVKADDGRVSNFSSLQLQHCLEAVGLNIEQASNITSKIYETLLHMEIKEIPSQHIIDTTNQILTKEMDSGIAFRYVCWTRFIRSNKPLILLIGGTAGCGKSTIATELAHRLEIVRIQSTDMLREVMRMMIPDRLMPVLHCSSFNAWKELPQSDNNTDEDLEDDLINGYRAQAELLAVAIEAAIQRALHERVSLIVEGVHVHPSLLDRIQEQHDAIIIPVMLAALKPDELRRRLKGRGQEAPERRSKRYLKHFEAIWKLQIGLLSDADQSPFFIIPNDDKEKAIKNIMQIILDQLIENCDDIKH